jgi:hypothetical protein
MKDRNGPRAGPQRGADRPRQLLLPGFDAGELADGPPCPKCGRPTIPSPTGRPGIIRADCPDCGHFGNTRRPAGDGGGR